MGVAGEVIQRVELAEDGHAAWRAERLLHFVERGHLDAQQKPAARRSVARFSSSLLRMNAKTKDLPGNSSRDRTGYNRGSYNMLTVLVIDEDTSLRETIGLLLEKEGYSTVVAEEG